MRLTIPDPALVLLIGPSGAGKSTLAARHFRTSEIVSSDALRELLTDDAGDQGASAEAFRIVSILVRGRLTRRLMTVVDATNLRAADRKRYRQMAARHGMPTVAIAFDLDWDLYHARNSGRPDRVVHEDVVENQASRMDQVLADLGGEGYSAMYVLRDGVDGDALDVVRTTAPSSKADANRRGGTPMLVLDLKLSAGQVLAECDRRGLVVRSQRELAGRRGSRHWHLRFPGRPGTLELNAWQERVWVNVHPLRDGGWAGALARELAALGNP